MIDRPLQTFSVAFEDRAFNELEYAREVARAIGADVARDRHRRSRFLRRAAAAGVARGRADRPPLERAAVLRLGARAPARHRRPDRRRQRRAARRLRQVSAGVAGTGAPARSTSGCCRPAMRESIAHGVVPRLPGSAGSLRAAVVSRDGPHAGVDVLRQLRVDPSRATSGGCWRRRLRASATPRRGLRLVARITSTRRPAPSTLLDRLLYADIKTYLVELLMKQDQMSMATSIESRVPFLDHKLVEFAATLPDEWKLSRLDDQARPARVDEGRRCRSRSSTGRRWASRCRSRRWMRGALERRRARGAARPPLARARHHRAATAVEALLRDHADGRTDGGDRIWSLLNLELWHRTFIDGDGVQTLPRAGRTCAHRSAVLPWSKPH